MTWKDPKRWEEMKRGINCRMCADIEFEENAHSFKVTELKQSYVRLPKNQYWHGWVTVFLKRHANELFELSNQELSEFWQDVSIVAKAVQNVFQPVKINYAIYGNLCPHIHCHIFPQRFENDPHAPIKQDEKEIFLEGREYQEMIDRLRNCIQNPR
ncbi:MAG TPA: HIT family protein [Patescibacteria group bacterium]|nr:HIT family protein [Patescibacteria group bacterium]